MTESSSQHAPPTPRKASKAVKLTIVGAVGALLIGFCAAILDEDDEVVADCVDAATVLPDGSYAIADDRHCADDASRGGGGGGPGGSFLWYYAGRRLGARVGHGTVVRPDGVPIVSRQGTAIQRGGFGGRGGGGS